MAPRVLLLGGNATVSRLMTTAMLSRSWDVISTIRNLGQKSGIIRLAYGQKGKIEVLECDMERITCVSKAQSVLAQAQPDYVIFVAGSMSNPFGVDRDAAKNFMEASANEPSVTKFLYLSFPASRRHRAPWWSDREYSQFVLEKNAFPDIQQAKLEADEYLVAMSQKRIQSGGPNFQAISLRPTWMTNSKGIGKVRLGQAGAQGQVTREDVAAVTVALLSRDDTYGWFDLFQGDVEIERAIDAVVHGGISSIEGEDVDRMCKLVP